MILFLACFRNCLLACIFQGQPKYVFRYEFEGSHARHMLAPKGHMDRRRHICVWKTYRMCPDPTCENHGEKFKVDAIIWSDIDPEIYL